MIVNIGFSKLSLCQTQSRAMLSKTGGLRKIKVASKGKGKRGGSRIIYYFLDEKCRFYLLTIYAKNEMSDLTVDQKKQLKAFMEMWRNEQS